MTVSSASVMMMTVAQTQDPLARVPPTRLKYNLTNNKYGKEAICSSILRCLCGVPAWWSSTPALLLARESESSGSTVCTPRIAMGLSGHCSRGSFASSAPPPPRWPRCRPSPPAIKSHRTKTVQTVFEWACKTWRADSGHGPCESESRVSGVRPGPGTASASGRRRHLQCDASRSVSA